VDVAFDAESWNWDGAEPEPAEYNGRPCIRLVRPHQAGSDDAVQYTPVFNGISSWQLCHGPGFWSPVPLPLDDWFTIRVAFAGERAEIFVGDLDQSALVARLRGPVVPGRVGLFIGGPAVHLARFAVPNGWTSASATGRSST
jgi:hypothetical protein